MQLRTRRRDEPEIVVIPLIDVLLMLLIFFMVATSFDKYSQMKIKLPESSAAVENSEQAVIDIAIDAQGRYYVNKQELLNTQSETLKQALQKAAEGKQEPQLILSADRMTPHQAVITAMDAARQLGFVNLTFATSSSEQH
ncbi:MAG TPA: biopolymer transporter ExbD [Gammaproteobacteria bacterium]